MKAIHSTITGNVFVVLKLSFNFLIDLLVVKAVRVYFNKFYFSSKGENELQIDLSRGSRNRNFSHEETLLLLDIWGNTSTQRSFESPYLNSKLWEYIANKISKSGFKRSVIECKTKVTNLKCQYYKLKRQTASGKKNCLHYKICNAAYKYFIINFCG